MIYVFHFSSVVKIMISQCWTTSYDLLLLLKLFYLLFISSLGNNEDSFSRKMVTPKLTYALEYVKTVKDKFKDTRQKFDEFLEVIVDFRAEKYSFLFLVNARLCTFFSSISVYTITLYDI